MGVEAFEFFLDTYIEPILAVCSISPSLYNIKINMRVGYKLFL